jgi:hypothetical protein
MLLFVKKWLADLDIGKEIVLIQFFYCSRLFVFPGLLEVNAITRAIQRYFTLLATALRTNSPMNRRTEALFFPRVADRAGQLCFSWASLCHGEKRPLASGYWPDARAKADFCSLLSLTSSNSRVFLGYSGSLIEKTRIKCGNYAVFPQAWVLR